VYHFESEIDRLCRWTLYIIRICLSVNY